MTSVGGVKIVAQEGPTPGYPLQGKAKTIPAPPSVTKKVEKK